MVFKFYGQNIREYHQKLQKKSWNPGHKIKKICAVYIEILLWWYFGQEYSLCIFRFIKDLIMTWHYFRHCFWGFKGRFSSKLQIWQKRNKKKVKSLKIRRRRRSYFCIFYNNSTFSGRCTEGSFSNWIFSNIGLSSRKISRKDNKFKNIVWIFGLSSMVISRNGFFLKFFEFWSIL